MTVSKESLSDLKEKYEKAEKLVEEESKQDPPSEPYRSHYAARDILIELQHELKDLLDQFWCAGESCEIEDDIAKGLYTYILGFVYKDTGRICVWTEELANGEKYLQECIDLLEPYKLNPECVNAYVGAMNQMGILWSIRQDSKKSRIFLEIAEQVYSDFKKTGSSPMTIYDNFGTRDEIEDGKGMEILEKTHTMTLFYMAQILGQLGDLHKSAIYCHTTLKRQLESNDYDPIEWALNAATLSQYFFSNDRNTESRHHLAAASYILGKYETEMFRDNMSEDEKASVLEKFNHRSADVMRCWAKYGLNILLESKNRLMQDTSEEDTVKTKSAEDANLCRFTNLNVIPFEAMITDQYCLMFDDAKPVYLAIHNWLNKAKEYYTAESEASEYAKIIQDLSCSFKYLAFFDFDENNQCKLHKRRADLLEDLLSLLNPTYYMAICRELWYELGLAYTSILDIKLDIFERIKIQENPGPHVLNKINTLCKKSIEKFESFIDSYKDANGEIPTTLSDDDLSPIIFGYFQIARLFYKIITPNKQQQIINTQNSLKYYKLFVKSCEERKTIAESMKGECGVCKEMTLLLPLKIQKLQMEIKTDE